MIGRERVIRWRSLWLDVTVRSVVETHSIPPLPHRNTTSLRAVALERSTTADDGLPANGSELSARMQISNGNTRGVTSDMDGFKGTGTPLHQRRCHRKVLHVIPRCDELPEVDAV